MCIYIYIFIYGYIYIYPWLYIYIIYMVIYIYGYKQYIYIYIIIYILMVSYIWLYHIPMIFPHYTHSPIEFLVKSPSFAQESAGSPMNVGSGNDSPTCLGHDLQYVGRCTKKHGTWPRYFIFMEYIYISIVYSIDHGLVGKVTGHPGQPHISWKIHSFR